MSAYDPSSAELRAELRAASLRLRESERIQAERARWCWCRSYIPSGRFYGTGNAKQEACVRCGRARP